MTRQTYEERLAEIEQRLRVAAAAQQQAANKRPRSSSGRWNVWGSCAGLAVICIVLWLTLRVGTFVVELLL